LTNKASDLEAIFPTGNVTYVSPGGSFITLPKDYKPVFTGSFTKTSTGEQASVSMADGVLLGFRGDENAFWGANITVKDGAYTFNGYKNKTTGETYKESLSKDLGISATVFLGFDPGCDLELYTATCNIVIAAADDHVASGSVPQNLDLQNQTLFHVFTEEEHNRDCLGELGVKFYDEYAADVTDNELLQKIFNVAKLIDRYGETLYADFKTFTDKNDANFWTDGVWTNVEMIDILQESLTAYHTDITSFETLLKLYDAEGKEDKFTYLAWMFVERYYESVSVATRAYILKKLSRRNMYGNMWFGNGEEFLALKLLETVQTASEGKQLTDLLKSDGTLESLYNRIDDEGVGKTGSKNFTRFIVTVSYWALNGQTPNIKSDNIYYWDDSFIDRSDINYSSSFQKDGNLKISIYNTEYVYNGYSYSPVRVLDTEKSSVDIHPFDWIPVRYGSPTEYLPQLGEQYGNITFVPAIYLHALQTKHLVAVTKASINTAVNVGSIFLGAGAFTSAYKIVRIVGAIDAIVTTADIVVTWTEHDIKQLQGGDDFLNAWAVFNVAVGVAGLGIENIAEAGVQNLDDFTNFIYKWDDLKKTYGNDLKTLSDAYGSPEEVVKTEELVEQVAEGTGTTLSEMFEPGLINNLDDIEDVGITDWRTFETAVSNKIINDNPLPRRVGAQISLDVHYLDAQGIERKVRIIADNLVEVDAGSRTFKIIDAKTSKTKDLVALDNLSSTCTPNQKIAYPIIEGVSDNTITKVVVKGKQAQQFGMGDLIGTEINLEAEVGFFVNTNNTNFTEFTYRPRIAD